MDPIYTVVAAFIIQVVFCFYYAMQNMKLHKSYKQLIDFTDAMAGNYITIHTALKNIDDCLVNKNESTYEEISYHVTSALARVDNEIKK
jgi:hypothetical protein